ncbi:hypothetical protein VCSRO90_2871 [Vibrio cholerae]|nr:hypothetical protein VCSRO90_2871 [Vibrio cholerae]
MMKNCECGAEAELFDLTTDTGTIQHQVICSSNCGRETAIWGGHSSLSDAVTAWNSDNVTKQKNACKYKQKTAIICSWSRRPSSLTM